jgi:hypothetical protein
MGIDAKAAPAKVIAELPLLARWHLHGTPLDFDFRRAQHDLRRLTAADLNGPLPLHRELCRVGWVYRGGGGLPSTAKSKIRSIDPEAYPTSEWQVLVMT